MSNKSLHGVTVILISLLSLPVQAQNAGDVVEAYISAYNEQNVDDMIALVTDSVRWMSVDGVRIRLESVGKEALGAGVSSYFASLPSARSAIRSLSEVGDFVTVVEEASWISDGAPQSQCAVSVYQVSDGLIASVWYFAAQACAAESGA